MSLHSHLEVDLSDDASKSGGDGSRATQSGHELGKIHMRRAKSGTNMPSLQDTTLDDSRLAGLTSREVSRWLLDKDLAILVTPLSENQFTGAFTN